MTPGTDHVFTRAPDRPTAQRAHGCTIVTRDGRSFLDGAAGAIANSIGHGHPAVVAALSEQAASVDYVHATQFSSDAMNSYADRVAQITPIDRVRVFPVSGGSEANETAFKLARSYHLARGEDRHLIMARSGAYHGNTRGVLDASDRAGLTAGYEPWIGRTVRAPLVNPYRDNRSGEELVAATEQAMVEVGPERIAAFIAEPISGATLAAMVPPPDYWPALADLCARRGILLIMDEVMTGFGRTGRWFAADHWGIRPDMITAGKGASSGYWPLGLCLAAGHLFDEVDAAENFAHGFTWSHHPMGAAVAAAVLDVLDAQDLVTSAGPKGARLRSGLEAALATHSHVGDIRGLGLLNGVEFVADRVTKSPFPRTDRVCEAVVDAAFAQGLTVYPSTSAVDGVVGDAVLLGPPLSVTDAEIDEIVARFARAVGTTEFPTG